MADSDGIAPHQHQWHLLMKDGEEPRVMPNSSCAICGLTPEAVANAAAIETLRAEISRLNAVLRASETEVERLRTEYAAAMAIVRDVAEVIWSSYCPWCHRHGTMREVEHDDDCPVLAARAITGITPTEEDD